MKTTTAAVNTSLGIPPQERENSSRANLEYKRKQSALV